MSSIRPIITLSIIVIAGVFMYRKINEGPAQLASTGETFQSSSSGTPPLAMSSPGATGAAPAAAWSGGTTSTEPTAPKWTDTVKEESPSEAAPIAQPPVVVTTPSGESTESTTTPGIPPIPALPPIAEATTPATTASSIEPPVSIPTAHYDSETTAPVEAPSASPFGPVTPAEPVAAAAAGDDRYAATTPITPPVETPTTETAVPTTTAAAAASPLAVGWPEIQGALDRQELAQAHQMLSQFYGNPSLSPSESQQVEALLSQLAGTVVYSTEHRLEPPYVVNQGETLETIAAKYEVPWQLLAKINGIPASNLVQPGQELKVVHGPFSAVVELGRGQMTLMLGDRYAGRFPIITEPTAATCEGQWMLEQKLVNPSAPADGVVSASYDSSIAPVERTLVLRNESAAAISIASGVPTPSGPTVVAPAAFRVSPQDAEELADILSVGSRITIRK